jgi:ubiquinone/menaquinone biosynthesis C-methylase UbiE
MTTDDHFDVTLRSYDTGARFFAERVWSDRLERPMRGFRNLLAGGQVLDLGCGAGRDVEWLSEIGYEATGVDLSSGMLMEGRQRLPAARFVRADVRRLPFGDASVDGAWVCSSLVHLDPQGVAMSIAELSRVLRSEGALYVGVEEGEGHEWRSDDGHQRLYYLWDRNEFADLLTSADFTIEDQFVEHVEPWHFITTLASRR